MRQQSVLQTKLYIPPIRPELVSRPRLIERLNAALPTRDAFPRALTLISAPAGFGKTTLVSEWVHAMSAAALPIAVAWLSLDEGDNDPARFLAYLIAALRTLALPVPSAAGASKAAAIEPRQESATQQEPAGNRQAPVGLIGGEVLSALQSPQPPPAEAMLTSLINEIAARPDRIVLVLDDYHLIEAQAIHDAVGFLLEHMPPQLHLVIASREDPYLALARLRARGQLTEIRGSDLRFTSSEAAGFLNGVMGLDLSAEDIAALETRTEGWIAGLHLAAVSMQGHGDASRLIKSFTGSHRFVLDYLVEEVLQQQPESVQTFLLHTAILDRLTGPLCDAVCFGIAQAPTGQADGQATLEMLERANLFIAPLDEERCWYRYHRLFADLLRQRLHQMHPDWIPTLHRRASDWYEQNGFPEQAIEHALQTEDRERAARLIDERAEAVWLHGEHAQLQQWLAKLPDEAVFSRPQLCVYQAWYLFSGGQQDAAERRLQACEQRIELAAQGASKASPPDEESRISDAGRLKLKGMAAVIRAFMATYLGDVGAMAEHGRQALEVLPERDLIWRSIAAMALGDALGFKGDMEPAYQARLQAAEAAEAAGATIFSTMAYLKVAVTLREQAKLQRTIDICRREIQRADSSGLTRGSVVGALLAIWGEALAELGDLERAIDLASQGVALTERGIDLAMRGWSYMCLTRILFSAGDMAGAGAIVQKMVTAAQDLNLPAWIRTQMAGWQARLWLAQGRLEAASRGVAQRGLEAGGAPKPPHELGFVSLLDHLVLARILIAQARLEDANRLLRRLLEAAEAGTRTSRSIEIRILQSLAFQAGGEATQAMTALERALALAEPEGFVSIFVDEGPPIAHLLHKAASRGISPDYARRLLAAFPVGEPDPIDGQEPQAGEQDLVEPLSERELNVLHLIAEGLTNREIASRLFLSLNTVKAHTRNIYGKLGVHNRTQAVARARALGMLPST